MNELFKLRFIVAALFAMIFTVACESSETEEVYDLTDAFSLTLVGNEVDALSLKVEVTGESVTNYVVGVVTKSAFSSTYESDLSATAAGVVAELSSKVDFAAADDTYVFTGSQTVDVASAWTLEGGVSYMIVVFGVNSKGAQTTNVAYKSVTTDRSSLYSEDYLNVIYINEIDPNNDVVELYSSAVYTVDFAGFTLSTENGVTYTFPSTEVVSGGYLLAGIDLKPAGEVLTLLDEDGKIIDEIDFSSVANGSTYGRAYDGYSTWTTFSSSKTTLGSANGMIVTAGEPFDVSVIYTSTSNILLAVTPCEEIYSSYNWSFTAVPTTDFEDYYYSNPALLAEEMLSAYRDYGVDLSYVNSSLVFLGPGVVTVNEWFYVDYANTEYTIIFFALDSDGYQASQATVVTATSNDTVPAADAAYSQWVGDWTITSAGTMADASKQVSLEVTIYENSINQDYFIYGWDTSSIREYIAYKAYYNSETGDLEIWNDSFLYYMTESDTGYGNGVMIMSALSSCTSYPDGTLVSGTYPAITCNSDSDGYATGTTYVGELSTGEQFNVHCMLPIVLLYSGTYSGYYLSYGYADDYATSDDGYEGDDMTGPYTMVRNSATTSSAKAPAKPDLRMSSDAMDAVKVNAKAKAQLNKKMAPIAIK